jgi:hypothetical protein
VNLEDLESHLHRQDQQDLSILAGLEDQLGLEDRERHPHLQDQLGPSTLVDQRGLEDLESHLHRQDQQDLGILAGLVDPLGLVARERHPLP